MAQMPPTSNRVASPQPSPLGAALERVGDREAAGWAIPARLERRAARFVAERLVGFAGRCCTSRAPVGEQAERTGEVATVRSQGVVHPRRPLGVRPRNDEAAGLETPEPIGQDVRSDAGEGIKQVVVPPRAVEQGLDDEQAPPVADALEGGAERRGLRRRDAVRGR